MKRAYLIAGVTALALATTSTLAFAHGGGKGMGKHGPDFTFEEVDANKDGQLTKDEIKAHFKARFDKADTDGNGALSVDEMKARMQAMAVEKAGKRGERMFERMLERRDANGDGQLQLDEMGPPDKADRMFSRVDENEDGMISAEEFAQIKDKRMKHRGEKMKRWHKKQHENWDN